MPRFPRGVVRHGDPHGPDHRIEFHPPRVRMLLLAAGSAAFAVGCAALVPGLVGEGPLSWLPAAACALGVPFFGAAGVFALRRVLRRAPVVVLDRHGMHDDASLIAAGFLPWAEVLVVRCHSYERQRFLGVHVRDPGLVLQRLGPLRRCLVRANLGLVGAAVNIPQIALPVGVEALWREIRPLHPGACRDEPADDRPARRRPWRPRR